MPSRKLISMHILEKMFKKNKPELTSAERYGRRKELNRLNAELLMSVGGQRQALSLENERALEQRIRVLEKELGPEIQADLEYERRLAEQESRESGKRIFGKGDFTKQN